LRARAVRAPPRKSSLIKEKWRAPGVPQTPEPVDAAGRWSKVVELLLRRDGGLVDIARHTRRVAGCCSQPSFWQARVWEYVREISAVPRMACALQLHEVPLTLCSTEWSRELLELSEAVRLQERRWRHKWARWLAKRMLLRVFPAWAAMRPPRRHFEDHFVPSKEPGSLPASATQGPIRGSSEELTLAAELGLDVDTYRMLRQLEERDIVPEDYDVLLRLDESVAAKTLAPPQLRRFPTEVYARALAEQDAPFGIDFWRLPLPPANLEDEEQSECSLAVGFDYWRLPVASTESTCSSPRCANGKALACDEAEVCAVCFMEFEDGDKVRRLPCRHLFHKHCIDSWLLGSSTRCPVDNQEVCC